MNGIIERSFPPQCPNCGRLNAEAARPHCVSLTCPWLRCICGTVFNEAGVGHD